MSRELPASRPRLPSQVMVVAKVGMTAAAVWLLARLLWHRPPPLALLREHAGGLIAAALLRPLFSIVLALRLHTLVRTGATAVRFGTVLRATFLGQMGGLVLPSAAGGDFVRGTVLARHTNCAWQALVGYLVVDRLLGTLTLALYTAAASYPLLRLLDLPPRITLAVAAAAVAAAGAVWWAGSRVIRHPAVRVVLEPARHIGFRAIAHAAGLAFAGHTVLILSCTLVIGCVAPAVAWPTRFAAVTFSLLLSSLPLTIGGHGVREGVLVVLLAAPLAWMRWAPAVTLNDGLTVAGLIWLIHVGMNLAGGLIALPRWHRVASGPSLFAP